MTLQAFLVCQQSYIDSSIDCLYFSLSILGSTLESQEASQLMDIMQTYSFFQLFSVKSIFSQFFRLSVKEHIFSLVLMTAELDYSFNSFSQVHFSIKALVEFIYRLFLQQSSSSWQYGRDSFGFISTSYRYLCWLLKKRFWSQKSKPSLLVGICCIKSKTCWLASNFLSLNWPQFIMRLVLLSPNEKMILKVMAYSKSLQTIQTNYSMVEVYLSVQGLESPEVIILN